MKTLKKVMIVAVSMVGFFALVYVGNMFGEKDPAYLPRPATYYGRPAFVQLHRYNQRGDGIQWITFYRAQNADFRKNDPVKDSRLWVIDRQYPTCTVPTELALTMYHATPGYPK